MNSIQLSLSVGFAATLLTLPLAIFAAWFLEKTESKTRPVLQILITLPLVLPPVVIGYLLLALFSPSGKIGSTLQWLGVPVAFHWLGAVVSAAVVGFPLFVTSIALSMREIDSRLERISASLGASRLQTFFRITLPLAWPGILSGAALAFARGLGEFGATIILAGRIPGQTETIPLAIYAELDSPGGETKIAWLVFASIAICVILILVSRIFQGLHKKKMESES